MRAPEEGPFEGVRERFRGALSRAVEGSLQPGLYTGPLWDLPEDALPEGWRGWKLSVLRRIPGRGAEPWGHLYLLAGESPAHVTLTSVPALGAVGTGSAAGEEWTLSQGPLHVRLLARPRNAGTAEELRRFSERVAREYPAPPGAGTGGTPRAGRRNGPDAEARGGPGDPT